MTMLSYCTYKPQTKLNFIFSECEQQRTNGNLIVGNELICLLFAIYTFNAELISLITCGAMYMHERATIEL